MTRNSKSRDERGAEDDFTSFVTAAVNLAAKLDHLAAHQTKEIPYETFDPAIVALCRAINEFPGIVTVESCQGSIDGHRKTEDGQPAQWSVHIAPHPKITLAGYCSLEFLAWVLGKEASAAGFDVVFGLKSPPPYLNEPGQAAYFYIHGVNRHPDELAQLIKKMREERFALPDEA
jgi:Methyltransferase TYW3